MATKPVEIPRWSDDDPGTTRDEPSEEEKDTGWGTNAVPTHGAMNWLQGVNGDWCTWLDERLFDEYTEVTKSVDCLLYGDPDEGLEVRNAAGDRLPVICSDPPDDNPDLQMTVPINYIETALAGMLRRCSARCTGSSSLTQDTPTAISFDSVSGDYDENVGGMIAVPDTDVIIQASGTYRIEATADLQGGGVRENELEITATRGVTTTPLAASTAYTLDHGNDHLSVSVTGKFVIGDVIKLMATTWNTGGGVYSARISVTQITGETPSWA